MINTKEAQLTKEALNKSNEMTRDLPRIIKEYLKGEIDWVALKIIIIIKLEMSPLEDTFDLQNQCSLNFKELSFFYF